MKVGRNDPCPCGSGKKYKKCCLPNEEKKQAEAIKKSFAEARERDKLEAWEPEDEELNSDFDSTVYEEAKEDNESQFDDTSDDLSDFLEDYESQEDPDDLPEISKEDQKIVDDWWEKNESINNAELHLEHLIQFIDTYPHLVENLGLDNDLLYNLDNELFIDGKYELFVALLLRIRKEFPKAYEKCHGYFNVNLLLWHIVQGRIEEISPFFDWFRQDEKGISRFELANIIIFFRATDHADILINELESILSLKMFKIVRFNRIVSQYIDKPVSDDTISLMWDEVASQGFEPEWLGGIEALGNRFTQMKRPFTEWEVEVPKKKSQIDTYYINLTDNFTYFLYQKTGISYDCAEFYADTIYNYYDNLISKNRCPKDIFSLDQQSFNENAYYMCWDLFDCNIMNLVQLNALYYFAEYLHTCGNMTEERKNEFQQFITGSFRDYFEDEKDSGPIMLSFSRFPIWELRNTVE